MALPTSLFIFLDLTAKGFWLTEWTRRASTEQKASALETLLSAARDGALKAPPTWEAPLADAPAALAAAAAGEHRGRKLLLRCS